MHKRLCNIFCISYIQCYFKWIIWERKKFLALLQLFCLVLRLWSYWTQRNNTSVGSTTIIKIENEIWPLSFSILHLLSVGRISHSWVKTFHFRQIGQELQLYRTKTELFRIKLRRLTGCRVNGMPTWTNFSDVPCKRKRANWCKFLSDKNLSLTAYAGSYVFSSTKLKQFNYHCKRAKKGRHWRTSHKHWSLLFWRTWGHLKYCIFVGAGRGKVQSPPQGFKKVPIFT